MMDSVSLPLPPELAAAALFDGSHAEGHRSGFCALLGQPNVGKSTLINRLVGTKVAIVTPKPQTTRNRILGIVARSSAQLVLVDTPGLALGMGPLRQALTHAADSAVSDADLTLMMVEVGPRRAPALTDADRAVLRCAREGGGRVLLALNKVDELDDKRALLPIIQAWSEAHPFEAILPISARRGEGVEALADKIVALLPEGPPLFPPEMHTDQAERFLCAELVREQLLYRTQQEVPHSAHVLIDTFEDGRDRARPICHLEGRIVLERDSQKAIVIGDGGRTIKTISMHARANIERVLGCQVYLRLSVHVDARWTRRPEALRRYGLSVGAQP